MKKVGLLWCFLLGIYSVSLANHLTGGELRYECLGNDKYKITLILFRTCSGDPVNNPAPVGIFDSTGAVVRIIQMPAPVITLLANQMNLPCYTSSSSLCSQQIAYTDTVTLPPKPGGYTIVYQRGFVANYLSNVDSKPVVGASGNVGLTIQEHIPDTAITTCNNSPLFKTLPPLAICVNAPFTFDYSVTDSDGDSISYELCEVFNGGTGISSDPPLPPPYLPVPWISPYSYSYPINASSAFAIHPSTGLFTGTPNQLGKWMIGVCAKEYKRGTDTIIGTHRHVYRIDVVACQPFPPPSVSISNSCYGGSTGTASATWNASNATPLTYSWIPGGQINSSITGLSPGIYTVSVRDTNGCQDSSVITIITTAFVSTQQTIASCSSDTVAISAVPVSANHQWYNPAGSPINSPEGINDTLIINGVVTNATYIDTITSVVGCKSRKLVTIIPKNIIASTSQTPVTCFGTATGTAMITGQSSNTFGYHWKPSGQSTAIATGLSAGIHTVMITSGNCKDSVDITITQPEDITLTFSSQSASCAGGDGSVTVHVSGGTQRKKNRYTYQWTVVGSSDSTIQNLSSGTYSVIVTDSMNCTKTGSITLTAPTATDTPNDSVPYCSSFSSITLFADAGATAYQWYSPQNIAISGATADSLVLTSAVVNDRYTVLVTPVLPSCPYYDTVVIVKGFSPDKNIAEPPPNVFTPNGDKVNDVFDFRELAGRMGYYLDNFTIKIYNRWGRLVFESTDVNGQWDGSISGSAANDGVYFWMATYSNKCVNEPTVYEQRGFVHLSR